MIYEVRLTPGAERDLERLAVSLAERSAKAAGEARAFVVAALATLRENPDRGYAAGQKERRQIVVRFGRDGYVLRYRVEADVVVVLRIFHGREQR